MWNPESTGMESGIHSVESGIQDSLGLPYMGRYKNVILFNNEGLGITLCEQTFWMFFSSKSAKNFSMWPLIQQKNLALYFFATFSLFCKKKCMQKMRWPFFVQIGNKRNLLSSSFSKISRAGDYSYQQYIPT